MKTVTAYKSDDGQLFEKQDEALAQDERYRFQNFLSEMLARNDMPSHGITRSAIYQMLYDEREKLREFFTNLDKGPSAQQAGGSEGVEQP